MKNPGIYQLNPANGAVLQHANPDIVAQDRFGGLASDGEALFHVQANNSVAAARLSLDNLSISGQFSFNCLQSDLSDLAFFDQALFAIVPALPNSPSKFGLMRFSPSGKLQQAFQFPYSDVEIPNFGLAADDRWLWVSFDNHLLKLDPATGNMLANYALPLQRIESLAWDGEQLWAASFSGEIFTIVVRQ